MNETPQLSEEMNAGPARIRIDVFGGERREHVLEDMNFMNYRLADVQLSTGASLPQADIVWRAGGQKSVTYDSARSVMTFSGPWDEGPIQKVIVAMLALRLEAKGWHPFHASAVRYRDKNVLFLGGESNHGKSMGQLEANRRGALLVSTETTVIDDEGVVRMGSRDVYVKKRAKGTERSDKAGVNVGVAKFFGEMPTWQLYAQPAPVDVVIVPAIDGNYDAATNDMNPFERQFQTLHSLQNYFLLNELLAPGWAMPLIDSEDLRRRRAEFVERFSNRPYFFIRAANPQVLMDEVEKVL
ncbi:MAG TPA: hypothetical protein VH371_12420 [Candidatus Limnocylindrales bacterium]